MFSICVLHLPCCKPEAWKPLIQGVGKDCRRNSFQDSRNKCDWFNENLSWETIFLATTLQTNKRLPYLIKKNCRRKVISYRQFWHQYKFSLSACTSVSTCHELAFAVLISKLSLRYTRITKLSIYIAHKTAFHKVYEKYEHAHYFRVEMLHFWGV